MSSSSNTVENTLRERVPLRRVVSIILLALLFAGAGIFHFIWRRSFESMVPAWLPAPRLLVAVSGVAEVLGAIGIMVPFTRRAAGYALIALLVAVFPANIHMLASAHADGASVAWQTALWLRLPLQPLAIWWVWWAAVKRDTPVL